MTQNNVQLQNGNGPLAGLRNVIINGDFNIWQRGVPTGNAGSFAYRGPDRWRNRAEINKTVCSLDEFAYSVEIIGSTAASFKQRVEMAAGSQPLAPNSTWTLSCWAEGIDAGQMGELQIDPDGGTSITGTPAIVETRGSWNHWAVTLTMNATMPTTYAEVSITSGGPQNWKLTGVQLEPGPIVTPFEQLPAGLELSLCQRYYQSFNERLFGVPINGTSTASTSLNCLIVGPINTFRGVPTVIVPPSGFTLNQVTGGGAVSCTLSVFTNQANSVGATLSTTVNPTSYTQLRMAANETWALDAEL